MPWSDCSVSAARPAKTRALSLDARALERAAAVILADELAQVATLHCRASASAIVVSSSRRSGSPIAPSPRRSRRRGAEARTIAGARSTLVKAHAARALDARHGAGQLSLGAQRAPTCDACDDGWRRVEEIVTVAEASARVAARVAAELDDKSAWKAARAANAAARDARRIVDERNHAYTFHADPGFSFGEGWYLAAAAVLAGVAIQIEPGKTQTLQAERFLRDAGLGPRLVPYRSRPRANKHLPEIVARAFRAGPSLRAAKGFDPRSSAARRCHGGSSPGPMRRFAGVAAEKEGPALGPSRRAPSRAKHHVSRARRARPTSARRRSRARADRRRRPRRRDSVGRRRHDALLEGAHLPRR